METENQMFSTQQMKLIMQMHEESILKFVRMNFELVNSRLDKLTKEIGDIQASINLLIRIIWKR